MEPYEGYDFYQAFKRGNKETNEASIKLIREIWMPHYKLTASMAQDLLKGRRCEIYDINGVVCETGRKCGIPDAGKRRDRKSGRGYPGRQIRVFP